MLYLEKVNQIINTNPHLFQIAKECHGCREKVAVFNMSYFAKYYLTGPDAQKAVDWIFTNNMAKPPGAGFFIFYMQFFLS